ncbi:YgaP family membrane protein [Haloarcula pellucida]|nr:DUF2892 domain-containing protein [Halomicroarcula pellucida]MBX0346729.1 DUF2892 domain-containing protein [Halomicroarcula pellucida]
MEKNVGGFDRTARFVVGPILFLVGIAALGGVLTLAAGTIGLVLGGLALLVGLVLTVTAVTQKCPLNSVIGLDTYRGGSSPDAGDEVDRGTSGN